MGRGFDFDQQLTQSLTCTNGQSRRLEPLLETARKFKIPNAFEVGSLGPFRHKPKSTLRFLLLCALCASAINSLSPYPFSLGARPFAFKGAGVAFHKLKNLPS
jgi:hypothetical protein